MYEKTLNQSNASTLDSASVLFSVPSTVPTVSSSTPTLSPTNSTTDTPEESRLGEAVFIIPLIVFVISVVIFVVESYRAWIEWKQLEALEAQNTFQTEQRASSSRSRSTFGTLGTFRSLFFMRQSSLNSGSFDCDPLKLMKSSEMSVLPRISFDAVEDEQKVTVEQNRQNQWQRRPRISL